MWPTRALSISSVWTWPAISSLWPCDSMVLNLASLTRSHPLAWATMVPYGLALGYPQLSSGCQPLIWLCLLPVLCVHWGPLGLLGHGYFFYKYPVAYTHLHVKMEIKETKSANGQLSSEVRLFGTLHTTKPIQFVNSSLVNKFWYFEKTPFHLRTWMVLDIKDTLK